MMKNNLSQLLVFSLLFVVSINGQGGPRGRGRGSIGRLNIRVTNNRFRIMPTPGRGRVPSFSFSGGFGRFPAGRPSAFGNLFAGGFFNFGPRPIGRPMRTNVTCATEMDEMICGLSGNKTGILVCRSSTSIRGRQSNSTRCIDPTKGRTGDVCGCCPGDENCPAATCSCGCESTIRRRGVETTFQGVSVTRTVTRGGRGRGRGRGFGRGGRNITTTKCVSPEDAVTAQIRDGFDCVAATDSTCLSG